MSVNFRAKDDMVVSSLLRHIGTINGADRGGASEIIGLIREHEVWDGGRLPS